MNRMTFEWTDKGQKAVRISRLATKKSFTVPQKVCKELIPLIKKGEKKAFFKMIREDADYLRALELDSQARNEKKCKNTALDTRYRLSDMLVPDNDLRPERKKDSVSEVDKTVKKVKAKAKAKV